LAATQPSLARRAAYVPGFLREVSVIFSGSPLPSRIAAVAEAAAVQDHVVRIEASHPRGLRSQINSDTVFHL
jgi:hypothetical protein